MRRPVVLRGYRFSVYNHIARVALHEKGVSYETEEINPFAADISEDYLKRHPFRRVPVLSHGEFDIYETAAIVRYTKPPATTHRHPTSQDPHRTKPRLGDFLEVQKQTGPCYSLSASGNASVLR